MEPKLKTQILQIIQEAESAYAQALRPENRETLGYPYSAGYSRSALENIRSLLEVA
jgi:hypothetical protein